MGLIRFADNIGHKAELIREIVRWPRGGNDDMVDALSDLFRTAKGGVTGDMIPDAPKFSLIGAAPPQDRFLGFDPITHEQKWLYDEIRGGNQSSYHPSTGAI